jgi:hypothetical protein
VQPGMTTEQVHAVMAGYLSTTRPAPYSSSRRYRIEYLFDSGVVRVDFHDDRVAGKGFAYPPKPSFWDKLRALLNRVRALF